MCPFTPSTIWRGSLRWLLLCALAFFSYLMLRLIAPYLAPPFPKDIDFLASKQDVINIWHWRWAFYIHISSSMLVLLCGFTQFSKHIMYKMPALHRTAGKVYVASIIFIAAPSGFLMALYANGGIYAKIAFVMQAVLWWFFTWEAYRFIVKRDLRTHAEFMCRSFALTLSAISLRAFIFLLTFLQIPLYYDDAYIFSAWTGWAFNLFLAEMFIKMGGLNGYFKK